MKLVSWNVNGIRACVKKGFLDYFQKVDADIFCIQETKLQENQIELNLEGYHQFWNYAERKGYSGTAVFTKEKPLSVSFCIELDVPDNEGRVITLESDEFYLVNLYTHEERGKMSALLEEGFIDSFRYFYPDQTGAYTWWSYMSKVRERNIGWRIDYFIVSETFKERLKDAYIHADILGSDHCPILLEIK